VYDASVAIHVVAALVGFGVTFSYPVIQLVAERHGPEALGFGLDAILAISRWVAVPATLVVGVTGIFQLADGPYSLSDGWLAASLGLYVAVMVVAVVYLAPAYRRAGDAARAGSAADYRAAIRGTKVVGPLVAAAVLAIAVLMEVKPG
jgi:uncharacterized membrane protein